MSRRVRLPAADELFRPTVVPDAEDPDDLDALGGAALDATGAQEVDTSSPAGVEPRVVGAVADVAGVEVGTATAPARTRRPSGSQL